MRHQYSDQAEKRADFWVGFIGWFVVNLVVLFGVNQMPPGSRPIGGAAQIVANIAAPIGLAFVRGYVALGIVAAFGTALGVTVSAGVLFTVGEFALIAAPPVGLLIWGLGIIFIPIAAWFAVRAVYRRIE